MSRLTPTERAMQARIAALTRVSRADYDGRAATEVARSQRLKGYMDRIDPDHKLPDDERRRKATAAWQADCLRGKLEKSKQKGSRR